jgi:DNA-binding NtrC family response regulator
VIAPELVGVSAANRAVEDEIDCAAGTDAKVLITGESGVGKEIVAQLIHRRSRRSRGPLITINCAGIPDTLLAAELFGHVRGSFTDAYRDRRGWIEQAEGGTILMDEVAEMSEQMQALLLRFLESGEIQPVGSDRWTVSANVRVITATNRHLEERVVAGEFREDLFYRLNVIHIVVPPLRERREDIPVLLQHFLHQFSREYGREMPVMSGDASRQLLKYNWPGNVRQVRNLAERLVLRADAGPIAIADLPREVLCVSPDGPHPASQPVAPSRAQQMFERMVRNGEPFWSVVYEPFMSRDITRNEVRELVRQGLGLTHGDYKALAEIFNVSPTNHKRMLNFLRKYQCHLPMQGYRALPVQVAYRGSQRAVAS